MSTKASEKTNIICLVVKEKPEKQTSKTLIREINEELSVTIDNKTLNYIGTFEAQAHGHEEGIVVK